MNTARVERLRRLLVIATVATACVCTACRPSGPLTVAAVQTGRSLNSDRSIGDHATSFRPDDTIHVAVLTRGPGTGTLAVRWRFGGRLISEDARQVSYRDSAATEFHIQHSGGFPPGDYTAEILLDAETVESRRLRVVAP